MATNVPGGETEFCECRNSGSEEEIKKIVRNFVNNLTLIRKRLYMHLCKTYKTVIDTLDKAERKTQKKNNISKEPTSQIKKTANQSEMLYCFIH